MKKIEGGTFQQFSQNALMEISLQSKNFMYKVNKIC